MSKVSILTIGDEICIGQVTNTNAVWIATQCTHLGYAVILHSTVGDDKYLMLKEIDRLFNLSDVLIITGGLGPTHDDITKPTLCEYFNDELVLHKPTLEHLEQFFKKRDYTLTDRNKTQAYIPSKCTPLRNDLGTAPGMQFEKDGKFIISLPGVPAEMKSIMEKYVFQFLQNLLAERKSDVVLYKTIHTSGIPESMLADLIGEPSKFLGDGRLAFLPTYQGVRLRIGITEKNIELGMRRITEIENIVRKRVGKYIFGENEETLSSAIGRLLKEKGKTLSVAESCTGGVLGGEITKVSGSSEYFFGGVIAYSNEAKINVLEVGKVTIEKYGAVSEQTAIELAYHVKGLFNTDYGISITGIAGPTGGTTEKPVGTVWIGLADENGVSAKKYTFGEDRTVNRERAVGTALTLLYKKLIEN